MTPDKDMGFVKGSCYGSILMDTGTQAQQIESLIVIVIVFNYYLCSTQ